MSAEQFKVRTGAATWQPEAKPKPFADEHARVARSAVPPQPTRVHAPEKLYREGSNSDAFVGSGHFNFIADTLAHLRQVSHQAATQDSFVRAQQHVHTNTALEQTRQYSIQAEVLPSESINDLLRDELHDAFAAIPPPFTGGASLGARCAPNTAR